METSKEAKEFELFLSHNWGKDILDRDNHARVGLLNKALHEANVITWYDAEQMGGHTGQAMADGIDASKFVAIFITTRYIDKVASKFGLEDNCRQEFDYSARRKGIKNLIPIVMEPACLDLRVWHGSLGATLANQLYIDCSTDEKMNDCVRDVLKRLNASKLSEEVQLEQGIYRGARNKDKVPHGYGIMKYKNGNNYEGPWVNGMKEGVGGKFKHALGFTYEGSFVKDKKDGHGTLIMKNGDRYEGQYIDDHKQGKGRFILAGGLGEYEGDYELGKMTGIGIFTYADGSKYEGEFLNHKIHGRGRRLYADKSVYKGGWAHGKKHGKGAMTFCEKSKYNGDWVDDNMEGKGTVTFKNGDKYTGDFKYNKMQGYGNYTYMNEARYDGEYILGKKWGSGKYTFKDKKQYYYGEWVNNKMHGRGVRYYNNDSVYDGDFVENKRHGQGRMEFTEGKLMYQGEWRDDVMHGTGKVNLKDCDSVSVNTKWWKKNPLLSSKIKDVDVTFEDGSLASSSAVKKKKKFLRRRTPAVPQMIIMGGSDDSAKDEILSLNSGCAGDQ